MCLIVILGLTIKNTIVIKSPPIAIFFIIIYLFFKFSVFTKSINRLCTLQLLLLGKFPIKKWVKFLYRAGQKIAFDHHGVQHTYFYVQPVGKISSFINRPAFLEGTADGIVTEVNPGS